MRRLLITVLIISMLLIPIVHASKIVYISEKGCGYPKLPCSCLEEESDFEYCNYLKTVMKHDVYLLSQGDVLGTSQNWNDYSPEADLIFLGNVSIEMAAATETTFCSNINTVLSSKVTKLFSTGINNYRNKGSNIKGCLFKLNINEKVISDFLGEENTCNGNIFRIINPGTDITAGLTDGLTVYTSNSNVYILNNQTYSPGGEIGISSCDPIGEFYKQNTYPIIHNEIYEGQVYFWGFDNPEKYESNGWELFRRTIDSALGEESDIPDQEEGTLTTNNNTYQPGNTIEMEFEPTTDLFGVPSIVMIYPDKSEMVLGPMSPAGNAWSRNLLIHDNIPNGTYVLRIDVLGSPTLINKTIDIIPYDVLITTDKLSYSFDSDVKITINAINKYKTSLDFTGNVTIKNPNNIEVYTYEKDFTTTMETKYIIPKNGIGGKYTINITLTDSDDRMFSKIIKFYIKSTGNLSVVPKEWSELISTYGTYSKSFSIRNNGTTTITNLKIIPGTGISVNKNTITLAPSASETFEATASVTKTLESNISLSTEAIEYIIDVEILYSDIPITNSLIVSPSSLSLITISDKSFEKVFELENIVSAQASINRHSLSANLEDIITIIDIPNTIAGDDVEEMKLTIDTTDLDSGTYAGTLKIDSSVGNDTIAFNIEILGDYTTLVPTKITELETYLQRINKIKNKEGGEFVLENYNNIKENFEKALEEYESENYDLASSSYSSALSGLNRLQDDIEEIELAPSNYGWIIWLFAIIIIISIIGVLFWKYKDKIMSGKTKTQEQDEYTTEQDGEYRTDYY